MNPTQSNQLFSFSRWRLLVAKHWVEHGRRYLLSLVAIGGLIAVWDAFLITTSEYAPLEPFMQFATYMIGLFFVGCLFASMLFGELGTKKEALPWLSLPASHLEKLLCAILYGVVLFYLAYTLVFYMVDIIMVQLSNNRIESHPQYWPGSTVRVLPVTVYNIFTAAGSPIPEKEYHEFTSLYFTVQAVFLLGSVYFTRFSFIKTVVAVLLFALVFTAIQRGIVYPLLPKGWLNNFLSWTEWAYEAGPPNRELRLPYNLEAFFIALSRFGLPLFFWFVTYLRLKEKET